MSDPAGALAVSTASLGRLHPDGIRDPIRIREIISRLAQERIELRRGMNRRIDPETALVERVDPSVFVLETRNFDEREVSHVYLSFSLDGAPYFMAAPLLESRQNQLHLGFPAAIFRAERRSRVRRPAEGTTQVEVQVDGAEPALGEVMDWSPEGLSIVLPAGSAESGWRNLRVRLLDGPLAGKPLFGEVRHREPAGNGWDRFGLDVSLAPLGGALHTEERAAISESRLLARAQQRWKVIRAGTRIASARMLNRFGLGAASAPEIPVVDYTNAAGERLRGIVDSWGDPRGATAVLIPPAWGRTKETLAPLAACIVEAFRNAGEPIVVLRFDGIRKKGESHNDPGCREPGREHHRFTFSQGARDIGASIDFLQSSERYRADRVFLVSFSASSIEARRSVAMDPRIHGWVCVVGSADLQSMMRVISGGIDYGAGLEQGLRFGMQEILGIEVDMDHAGLDAIENQMAFLEDARRDFSRIDRPVTWIHGRHDAWMDAGRVRDVMSRGETSKRRLIEVPTGHMLKTSREALETFKLIVGELSRMALGREVPATLPDLAALERRMRAERERLPKSAPDLRSFWTEYLLGRDRSLSFELMTSISPYERLMQVQVEALGLRSGDIVADLGSGTGAFPRHLAAAAGTPDSVGVVELDFVRDAFLWTRDRLKSQSEKGPQVRYVECDLNATRNGGRIPIGHECVDAVLASLFLSYVSSPELVLRDAFRILRPSGRLVVSTLRRDADMSKLFSEGLEELRAGRARQVLGREGEAQLEQAGRAYLNQASRLLGLEDEGVFRFWDAREVEELVRSAGFVGVSSVETFGNPPQAVVVSARRP